MKQRSVSMDIALIAVFAALVVVFSVLKFPMPGSPVPLTLQVLALALTGLVLGWWRGFAAVALWLVVGFLGAPVFAGGSGTVAVLSGPTAGFLLSFPLYALFCGLVAEPVVRRWTSPVVRAAGFIAAAVVGRLLVIFPIGAYGIARNGHMPYAKAVKIDVAFWGPDLVKVVFAALIAVAVHRAFPWLLASRRIDD